MNAYEKAVLRAVAKDSDYVGWYKIEQRLSTMPLLQRGYLPDALKLLSEQGFIEESSVASGIYKATAFGRKKLEAVVEDR